MTLHPAQERRFSVAVLVVSCDRYADLWKPFFHLLDRFWPERPGPVYLVTNEARPEFGEVHIVPVGPDTSWSDGLKKALRRIDEEFVLLWLEDLFLRGPIDEARVEAVLTWARKTRPNHVRLNPTEKPYAPYDSVVGLVPPGAPYRTSTVLTLWKRTVLDAILKEGENAWQFELQGSERSDAFDAFYSTPVKCFPVLNGVIRGKWRRDAVRCLKSLGAPLDLSERPVMSGAEMIRFGALVARNRIFKLVPWRYRRGIRRLRPI